MSCDYARLATESLILRKASEACFSSWCTWTCVLTHMDTRAEPWVSFLRFHLPYFFEIRSLTGLELAKWVVCLARKPWTFVCLHLLHTGITSAPHDRYLLDMGPRNQTHVLVLERKTLTNEAVSELCPQRHCEAGALLLRFPLISDLRGRFLGCFQKYCFTSPNTSTL